eukprot:204525_1
MAHSLCKNVLSVSRHCSKKYQYYGIIMHLNRSFVHKLSYDKQKNLNSIHNETKHISRQQLKNSPHYAQYNQCKNADEILTILSQNEDTDDIISHYILAIQKLASLQEFKLCWKMFSDITTEQKYLSLLTTNLYTTMMWLSCYQHLCQPDKIRNDSLRKKKTCDKIFSLLSAMKTKINLKLDCDTITTIISSCCKLQQFGRGEGFWKSIHNDDTFNYIQLNIDVYNAMIDLYCKSDQMSETYHLYENIINLENVKCDNITFSTLINGAHKHADINTAQKLFNEAKEYLCPETPNADVYCALMNGYASRGNVMKCWELFTEILANYDEHKNIEYKPDIMVFSMMLKSLCRLNNNEKLRTKRSRNVRKFREISIYNDDGKEDKLSVDDCWKMIKYIILKMKELNVKRNVVIYGELFHLTGDAFGEQNCKYEIANKFYEQMINEQIEMSSLCFHNFLRAGLCHYNVIEKDENKKENFVKWFLTEMKKYNVPMSSQTRVTLRDNGVDVIDYRDMDINDTANYGQFFKHEK